MKIIAPLLLASVLASALAHADEDAGAPKLTDAEFCFLSREPRVSNVQIITRRWLKRIDTMKAACKAAWVKSGAMRIDGNRIYPELKGDVQCPHGPPSGETKESVWNVLSLFLEEPVATDERMSVEKITDDANARCAVIDAAQGLELRPLVNDLPALRRILAWKPPAVDAGAKK